MRRAHVYQRSAPRSGHAPARADRAATARTIAAQLGHIIDKADQSGLSELSELLEEARAVAELAAGEGLIEPRSTAGTVS